VTRIERNKAVRRQWITLLWLAGSTVPAFILSAFLFGCCALPFHRTIHRYFPFCSGIVRMLMPRPHNHATAQKNVQIIKAIPTIVRAFSIDAVAPRIAAERARSFKTRRGFGRTTGTDRDIGAYLLN